MLILDTTLDTAGMNPYMIDGIDSWATNDSVTDMPFLTVFIAGAIGYLIAKENPLLGTLLMVGIMLATVLLIGAPQAGLAFTAFMILMLAVYLFIVFLPLIIFFLLGVLFFYAFIIALGHAVG
jgi:hypothetical protein